jgi:hypothetical protein
MIQAQGPSLQAVASSPSTPPRLGPRFFLRQDRVILHLAGLGSTLISSPLSLVTPITSYHRLTLLRLRKCPLPLQRPYPQRYHFSVQSWELVDCLAAAGSGRTLPLSQSNPNPDRISERPPREAVFCLRLADHVAVREAASGP